MKLPEHRGDWEHLGLCSTTSTAVIFTLNQDSGEPDLNPEGLLTRSYSQYVEGKGLADMIREDLVAERIAIDSYREMVRYLGDDDPTSRRLLEGILATEEEHAEDLRMLIEALGTGEPKG